MLRRLLGIALALAVATGTFAHTAEVARADGAWIDAPLDTWNRTGQPVPTPTQPVNRATVDPRCLSMTRPQDTLEDAQVELQGWLLIGSYTGGWDTRIVQATTIFDGMCRPSSYQAFVFYHGVYAGTLSPQEMVARSDGALGEVSLQGRGVDNGPVQITATFRRYKNEDPLCCASANSSVSYTVVLENGQPLVRPMQANTTPTPPG